MASAPSVAVGNGCSTHLSPALAVRVDGPAEAVLEVAEARLADPVGVSTLGMLGGRRVALGQHLRMPLDERPVLRREVGVHELRRAELTVIVLPGLAVDAVALPRQPRPGEIALLPVKSPVIAHRANCRAPGGSRRPIPPGGKSLRPLASGDAMAETVNRRASEDVSEPFAI